MWHVCRELNTEAQEKLRGLKYTSVNTAASWLSPLMGTLASSRDEAAVGINDGDT